MSLVLSSACANRGQGPQGGPKDEKPPVVLGSKPENGELNFNDDKFVIYFDEIVQVSGAAEKVVISPPQHTPPKVQSVGKKVIVELNDTLEANTSYSIDFGNSIADNNEKNELENFSITFSTGDVLDSLRISGMLLDARTLNPKNGVIVGIHTDFSDTAFTKTSLRRIAKTNKQGEFAIQTIKPDKYKIFGLQDIGSNFMFDMPNEMIAFNDSVIIPTVDTHMHIDTLWMNEGTDSAQIDTIIQHQHSIYMPDSVFLFGFVEDPTRQFLRKSSRKERYNFSLEFAIPLDSLPKITGLNYDFDKFVTTMPCPTMDTVQYWIANTTITKLDSLVSIVEYPKTDSVGIDQLVADTITFVYKPPRKKKEEKEKKRDKNDTTSVPKISFITLKTNVKSPFDFFTTPTITFTIPTKCVDLSMCRIEEKVDTLWKKIDGGFVAKDSIGLKYTFEGELKLDKEYQFVADSAAFTTIEGLHNNTSKTLFTTKSIEEYGVIKIKLLNGTGKEVVELLDKSDKVLRTMETEDNSATFEYLNPGDFYLRLFIDENGDGEWTNGNYKLKLQPEKVYYFPYKIAVKAFWDVEEEWNYMQFPINEQKPVELIKEDK